MACAHVGPELLLDGALLDDRAVASGVRTVYGEIATPDEDTIDLAPDGEHDRWRARISSVSRTRLDPFTYRDAAIVAQRLHTITARPRLAFDADLVGAVRARMVSVQPRIMSSATDVLDRVVGAVSGMRPRRRSTLRK